MKHALKEEAALAHAAQLHGCAASSWSWRKLRWPMQHSCMDVLRAPGAGGSCAGPCSCAAGSWGR